MKKIYIKDHDLFGHERTVNLEMNEKELVSFISLCTDEERQRMLDEQIENENFETVKTIKNIIEKGS
jgi:hypothetical protein